MIDNLRACGNWLVFPLYKRIGLFIRYWLPWVISAAWKSREIWSRYILWKILKTKPVVWGDLIKDPPPEEFKYVVSPNTVYFLYLSGRGGWLWYESIKQLNKNKKTITYPVDWDNKGHGWYPFW